jgi:hypothetical protein
MSTEMEEEGEVVKRGTEIEGKEGDTFEWIFRIYGCFLNCKTTGHTPRKGNMNDLLPLTQIL